MADPPKFEVPLTDEHLRAIGHLTAQWAALETMIDLLVFGSEINQKATAGSVPLAMSFNQRLRLWDALAGQHLRGAGLEQMRVLIRRASDVFVRRDAVTQHGYCSAEWLAEQIRLANTKDAKTSSAPHYMINVEDLERLAQETATINQELFDLCRAYGDKLFIAT